MENLTNIIGLITGEMWGKWILIALLGTGLLVTIRTGFIQGKLGLAMKRTFSQLIHRTESDAEGEISSFQALSTALSSTIGVGNIVGVGTAIAMGGPGAVFWMWVSAFFGMATKYSEIVLALTYREKDENGTWRGGPMYAFKNGLKAPWVGTIFAIFIAFVALVSMNMVQTNAAASVLKESYNVPTLATAIIITILIALVIMGGVKRLGRVTEIFVPVMAALYIIGSVIILIINVDKIIPAFGTIFSAAFSGQAAVGGFTGATIASAARFGVARGLFSNEAGAGTAPMAHAAAKVKHPVEQGIFGISEVFIDTFIVCTLTGLPIIITGAWQEAVNGAAMTTNAFSQNLGVFGTLTVVLGITLFAFSTALGASWYGETAATYVFGKNIVIPYKILWLIFTFIGCLLSFDFLWLLSDFANGFAVFFSVISIILLSGVISKKTKEYFSGLKDGSITYGVSKNEKSL
jgi:AGCS family alanine or glycine:cation symporter